MKFLHVCWFRRIVKLSKSVSHLIIDIIMLAQVNLLINNRLLFHNELKNYELYHNNYKFIQYFNYQKYNYIIKVCHNTQKYDIYIISEHNNHDCLLKNSFFLNHYINYNLEHSAWFTKYRVCKEQLKKTQLVYVNRLRKFIIMISDEYSADMYLLILSLFTFLQVSQDLQSSL